MPESLKESGKKPSSTAAAIINMVNAVLGAGIVSLPYAWAQAGFILGWIMFIITAIIANYTLELLINIADPLCRQGEISLVSYELLAERILGGWGKALVIVSQFLYAFGIGVSYVVIIHDELPTALTQLLSVSWFHDNSVLTVIIVACAILLPVSCLRDVSALAKASFFCFASAVMLIVIVSYELVEDKDALCDNITKWEEASAGGDASQAGDWCVQEWTSFGKETVLTVYGVFVFTKACHHTEFQIYRSLGENANPVRWAFVCRAAIVLCSVITSTCAMLTYAIFGVGVADDFFKSFWTKNTAVSLGRLMFSTLIMSSFPMQLFVSRETLQVLVELYMRRNKSPEDLPIADQVYCTHDDDEGHINPNHSHSERRTQSRTQSRCRTTTLDRRGESESGLSAAGGDIRGQTSNLLHFSTTIFLFALTFTIGLSTDNLGKVLNLVGGVAGAIVAFLLPGLIGFYSEAATGIKPLLGRPTTGFMIFFGTATMIISSTFTFVTI